jgi:hypothetical protein
VFEGSSNFEVKFEEMIDDKVRKMRDTLIDRITFVDEIHQQSELEI